MDHYSGNDPGTGCAYIMILGLAVVVLVLIAGVVWLTANPPQFHLP